MSLDCSLFLQLVAVGMWAIGFNTVVRVGLRIGMRIGMSVGIDIVSELDRCRFG